MNTFSLHVEKFLPNQHNKAEFDCGNHELNEYIKLYAHQDLKRHLTQIFILAQEQCIIGYYSINATSFKKEHLPLKQAQKLPHYPIPAALIGRIAVDRKWQKQGLGEYLLIDALKRIRKASQNLAVCAVVVKAKDEQARQFYLNYGFLSFIHNPLHLYLPMNTIMKLFSDI